MTEKILTNPEEFILFDKLLRQTAPTGYIPHYIAIKKDDKDPDWRATAYGAGAQCSRCHVKWSTISVRDEDGNTINKRRCPQCHSKPSNWKLPHARLSSGECVLRLSRGGNVGLAALSKDDLVILDGDEESSYLQLKELNTLLDKSRKRIGGHAFLFDATEKKILKQTIPTQDDVGEIRSKDAYVVIAGSYVPTENKAERAGCYTVENAVCPKSITSLEQLPDIYRREYEKKKESVDAKPKVRTENTFNKKGKLFELTFDDVLPEVKYHTSHPEHGSDTGTNFSISDDRKLCTCWRHNVTFGVPQYLAMCYGAFSCIEIGKPKNTNRKPIADWKKVVTCAYLEALRLNLISKDDVPDELIRFLLKNKDKVKL